MDGVLITNNGEGFSPTWPNELHQLCNEHARLIKYLQFAYHAYGCDEALKLINDLGVEK